MKVCVICEEKKLPNGRIYFCKDCYFKYKDDILSGKPWIRYLVALEQKNKRTRKKDALLVYLDDKYDISDDNELVKVNNDDEQTW